MGEGREAEEREDLAREMVLGEVGSRSSGEEEMRWRMAVAREGGWMLRRWSGVGWRKPWARDG